uniref:PAZ domain-containing protein n=1 Tax=Meloidogyne hapla TaxID=6305 RepID=A0A1I8BKQ6_MELHA
MLPTLWYAENRNIGVIYPSIFEPNYNYEIFNDEEEDVDDIKKYIKLFYTQLVINPQLDQNQQKKILKAIEANNLFYQLYYILPINLQRKIEIYAINHYFENNGIPINYLGENVDALIPINTSLGSEILVAPQNYAEIIYEIHNYALTNGPPPPPIEHQQQQRRGGRRGRRNN